MRYFCDHSFAGSCWISDQKALARVVSACPARGAVDLGVKVLISVVIKMTAMLRAKTVITGAKMTESIFVTEK